ncbi:MAG: hypothetical protein WCI63_03175 [bacterium]
MKINEIVKDPDYRRTLAIKNHQAFFAIYFSEYIQYPSAQLHKDIFKVTEKDELKMTVLVAFRGSGKSTIVTTSYPIWAILAKKVKFIVILTQNQSQSKYVLNNIKSQLEGNRLLISDFGPFQDVNSEWASNSIYIKKYNAKITVASVGESIRGIRHNESRPQIIICDDVEDTSSTKTMESRQKTYKWYKSEVVPLGDLNTKILVVGNLLHRDCLVMKLKRQIEKKEFPAKYMEFPLIDNGRLLWPGKYSSKKILAEEKAKIGDNVIWRREYLLEIIADEDQVVHPEWIQYYREMPDQNDSSYCNDIMGVDLAISEKATADKTAIICGSIFHHDGKPYLYIHEQLVNKRISSIDEVSETIKMIHSSLGSKRSNKLIIEDNGFQQWLIQILETDGLIVTAGKHGGLDKRSRLAIIARFIKNGQILFPQGCSEELVQQLVDFGVERHDDLMDAFCYIAAEAILNFEIPFCAETDFFIG